ncbi:MAG: L-histidine N(alpha)-methyltransferase [Acidimicrobiales bacterium]
MPPTVPAVLDVQIDVLCTAEQSAAELRRDALRGLTSTPKQLSPTWLYDDVGCALFDRITRLPEYYPTRRERTILARHAGDIARLSRADTLVEIGSGASDKTRLLLDALRASGRLARFVPFDIALPTLTAAARAVASEYEGIEVLAVAGDFRRHLGAIPRGGRRLFAFLGGTIGNLVPVARARFLRELAASMAPGDVFLVGTDLVKDRDRLVAAYDDDASVTAAFNKNVLAVLNRQLGADFDLDRFDHVVRFDEDEEWIEMRLRSRARQEVTVLDLALVVEFEPGEDLLTEVSAKFRVAGVRAELSSAGLAPIAAWTDPDGDFALTLAVR